MNVLADVAGYFPTGGGYTALSPGRLMDTRANGVTVDGTYKATGAVGVAERQLQVTGRYGIPTTGVAAVILNVTGVSPTATTHAIAWPTGSPTPTTSNLNLLKGEVKPNLVVAKLGTGGKVSFTVGKGSMHMVADVAGWIPVGSSYTPLTPGRLLDTRATGVTVDGVGAKGGAAGTRGTVDVKVTGRYGIPTSGVSAVVLNVTGVSPTAATHVIAFPSGETRPGTSNLNLAKGEVRPNLVIAKVGTNGAVTLYNNAGSTHLIADVAGWFAPPGPTALSVSTASLPAGVVAKAYPATNLVAVGGTGPYTWATRATAAVPVATGLTVSSAGVVAGTPDVDGARYLPVRVTDSLGATADKDVPVTITFQATAITTTSLPAATCNTAYSAQLAGTGSFFPDNWFLKSGTLLPTGLTMTNTGAISGTPTVNTSTPFTIQLVDAKGGVKEKALTITVTGCVAGPVVTTTSLASGTVGTAYSQTLGASGGTAPYTWSLASGALPAGLTLTTASGAITGTPTGAGTATFTVRATDSSAPTKKTADKALSITIAAPPPVNITTTTLPGGTVGTAYSQTLGATGGSTPYVWALETGALPGGLSISSGGVISGTPTTVGSSTFTVKVTGGASTDSQQLSIVVSPPPLTITTTSLPNAQLNSSYSQTVSATGGVPPYTWTLASGTLPNGITLTAGGSLIGTPTAAGTSNFTVQVKDNAAAPTTVTKALSLTVVVPPVVISPTTFPDGTVGVAYSQYISASGGASNSCTITVSSGALPAGLTLGIDPGFGDYFLSGAPNAAGTYSFTLQANCGGVIGTRAYSLVVKPAPLAITTTSLPPVLVGDTYSATLSAQGGTGPYTWSITSGALPAGLTLAANGQLSGTAPSVFGEGTATFRATDATNATVSKAMTIYVNEFSGESSFRNGEVGVAYTSAIDSSYFGGTAPYTFTTTGTVPAGLSLSTAGTLAGTPTTAGTTTFAVTATGADGLRAKNAVTVVIHPPGPALSITTATLPNGQVGKSSYSTLTATGGYAPYSWAVTAGTTPPGLSLYDYGCAGSATCWTFEGFPQEAGTYNFTLTVTDDGQVKASKAYSVTIAPAPLVITTASLPMGAVGAAYGSALNATGGVSPYSWSLTTGTMPAGLSLSSSGLISGTPTAAVSTSLNVKVTDSAAATANVTLNLVVGAPVSASTVSAGAAHTCAVASGKVRCWGTGYSGELGNGSVEGYSPSPVEVSGLTNATKVATGGAFSCAVLADGRVACWGANWTGQLGIGSTLRSAVPVFTGITNAVGVTAGDAHACALLSTGAVSCWGLNSSGQVGNGTASQAPVLVPTAVTGLSGASFVSAGDSHTCAVVTGGGVRCWGANSGGELGDGSTTASATPVTALVTGASQVDPPEADRAARD